MSSGILEVERVRSIFVYISHNIDSWGRSGGPTYVHERMVWVSELRAILESLLRL